jgi:hypothetical protein
MDAFTRSTPGIRCILYAARRNGSSEASWVTSFRGREPVGHGEYDMLENG